MVVGEYKVYIAFHTSVCIRSVAAAVCNELCDTSIVQDVITVSANRADVNLGIVVSQTICNGLDQVTNVISCVERIWCLAFTANVLVDLISFTVSNVLSKTKTVVEIETRIADDTDTVVVGVTSLTVCGFSAVGSDA